MVLCHFFATFSFFFYNATFLPPFHLQMPHFGTLEMVTLGHSLTTAAAV
jgi:hypothetical protein